MHNDDTALGGVPPGRLRSMVDHTAQFYAGCAYVLPHLDQRPIDDAPNFILNPDNAPDTTLAGEPGLEPANARTPCTNSESRGTESAVPVLERRQTT
jgi:hypothetical protein